MLVIPSEACYYQPKFTYVWTLGVGRFHEALLKKVNRETALPRDRPLLSPPTPP